MTAIGFTPVGATSLPPATNFAPAATLKQALAGAQAVPGGTPPTTGGGLGGAPPAGPAGCTCASKDAKAGEKLPSAPPLPPPS